MQGRRTGRGVAVQSFPGRPPKSHSSRVSARHPVVPTGPSTSSASCTRARRNGRLAPEQAPRRVGVPAGMRHVLAAVAWSVRLYRIGIRIAARGSRPRICSAAARVTRSSASRKGPTRRSPGRAPRFFCGPKPGQSGVSHTRRAHRARNRDGVISAAAIDHHQLVRETRRTPGRLAVDADSVVGVTMTDMGCWPRRSVICASRRLLRFTMIYEGPLPPSSCRL